MFSYDFHDLADVSVAPNQLCNFSLCSISGDGHVRCLVRGGVGAAFDGHGLLAAGQHPASRKVIRRWLCP